MADDALITGATSGIGRATALALAKMGFTILVHGRSAERVQRVVQAIRRAAPESRIDGVVADLARRADIERMAVEVRRLRPALSVLIHNAAMVDTQRTEVEEGIERQFFVNHLAPFLLTARLLDLLQANAPSRIIVVASQLESEGRLDFDDLQSRRGYTPGKAYCATKLANVLFAGELGRRLKGTGITAVSAHPGVAGTRLANDLSGRSFLLTPLTRYEHGHPGLAAGRVAALAADLSVRANPGAYYLDGKVALPSPQARDSDTADRLWKESARLLGIDPDFGVALQIVNVGGPVNAARPQRPRSC